MNIKAKDIEKIAKEHSVLLTNKIYRDRLTFKDREITQKTLEKAVKFTIEAHEGQKRSSGEPYYLHPIAVTDILAELKLDLNCLVTALLHDTVEDTIVTLQDIEKDFGKDVAVLVDGVTKLTKMEFKSKNHQQAENFRKLLMAISEDIRVLLVKLSDRLHNMRTLHYIKNDKKRKRIANETMDIYAPLAERIGMQRLKDELQNLSFQILNPRGYNLVLQRIAYLHSEDNSAIDKVVRELKKLFDDIGIQTEVFGRKKKPHSIWRKMQNKQVDFEQLCDIVAFRVIANSIEDCYKLLGIIHLSFHAVPEKFKDYISTPKNNGYQSLHTVVIGPGEKPIEIQIRTSEMHVISEYGVAAHWAYKQDVNLNVELQQFQWVRELMQINSQSSGESLEFMENTKLAMYHNQVFSFTPRGDLIALPKDATPVDFAFAVHSEVGKTCVGAKINGRIMPLRTILQNGDQVEIIQSDAKLPSPAWENFVVTGKARSEIRKLVREKHKAQYIKLGKEMLNTALMAKFSDTSLSQGNIDDLLDPILQKYQKKTSDDLFVAIGQGQIQRGQILNDLMPRKNKKSFLRFLSNITGSSKNKNSEPIPIEGLIPGIAIHYAHCCNPLPGERIIGVIHNGKGINIHSRDCSVIKDIVDDQNKVIDLKWKRKNTQSFIGRLIVTIANEKGALGKLANIIAKNNINIVNIRIENRTEAFFDILLDLEMEHVKQVSEITANLRLESIVVNVKRYKKEA